MIRSARRIRIAGTGAIDFGPLELRAFDYSEPPGADGFIGYNFFANHVVSVDIPGRHFLKCATTGD